MATFSWEGCVVRDPDREKYNDYELKQQKVKIAAEVFSEIEKYKGPMVVEIIEKTESRTGLLTGFPVDLVKIQVKLTAARNQDVLFYRPVLVDVPEKPTMKQRVKFLFTGKV